MTKFVWLPAAGGGRIPVNPDQVAYLRRTIKGLTGVVFGQSAGCIDQVEVDLSAEEVVAILEQRPGSLTTAAQAVKAPSPAPKRPARRRAPAAGA